MLTFDSLIDLLLLNLGNFGLVILKLLLSSSTFFGLGDSSISLINAGEITFEFFSFESAQIKEI
jgi:hypothetical protein